MKHKTTTFLLSVMIFAFCCLTICGCGGTNSYADVWDYYGECTFDFPFKVTAGFWTGYQNFATEHSMEEMCTLINEAGYTAELFDEGNVSAILISVRKDTFTYYFVIYDKDYFPNSVMYSLRDAELYYKHSDAPGTGFYLVLAPIHIIDQTTNGKGLMRVYGSFDYISDFYRSTGKSNFDIDEVNQTITFSCKGVSSMGALQGDVVIRFVETDDGNFIEIEKKSRDK